jgi:hypothetical protein
MMRVVSASPSLHAPPRACMSREVMNREIERAGSRHGPICAASIMTRDLVFQQAAASVVSTMQHACCSICSSRSISCKTKRANEMS